jgi:hypothetical protein
MTLRLIIGMLVLSLLGTPAVSSAAVVRISPQTAPDCHEEFEKVANTLQPGDELVLHGGTYSQSCRRAITVNGTAAAPIVIRAATGERPLITRPADNIDTQNNIEIVNSSHLIIRGLAFQGGSTGVRFIGGHHITLEDSEIYETGNNAISLNYGNTEFFVFRRNHIHHTGLSTSGPTEGEGFYAGCNNDTCRITNSLFEGNYIHHLRGTSDGGNDGIEIKVGSYNNVVRNNVIHDTTIGRRYPCIFIYGGGSGLNIVEGNVVWNCGEAIQVVSDAVIRNNIILSSDVGITAAPHVQVAQMRNVTIVNNTLYGHGQCLYARWDSATSMTLANNAMFCPGATAVDASGLGGSAITVRANYVEGGLAGASLDQSQFFNGGTAESAFTNPQTLDFWPRPTGSLLGKSDPSFAPANDFNERPRGAPADVGAYEANGLASNPGWRIVPGFKQAPLRRAGSIKMLLQTRFPVTRKFSGRPK